MKTPKRLFRSILLLILPIAIYCTHSSASGRVFTVRDSIEMVHFLPDPNGDCSGTQIEFSPDNHYFAFVTYRGIIHSNTIASSISVFSTSAVQDYLRGGKAPRPHIIARIASIPQTQDNCPYESTIFAFQWFPNSQGVLFTAEGGAPNERRLYEATLASGSMHALSPQGYDVKEFVAAGDSIAYEATSPRKVHPVGERINPDAIDITGQGWDSVLFPDLTDNDSPDTLWVVQKGMNRRITGDPAHPLQLFDNSVFSISPAGNALIILLPVKQIPSLWATFEPDPQYPYLRIKPGNLAALAPSQLPLTYRLVDLAMGKIQILIQAPSAKSLGSLHHDGAIWSPSGKRILITNTFLPLEGVNSTERAQQRYPCVAAIVDGYGSTIHCLVFNRYTSVDQSPRLRSDSFGITDNDVVLHMENLSDQTYTDEHYHFENGEWQFVKSTMSKLDATLSLAGALSVMLRQGVNMPPALWATDLQRGITKKLWDPNPQLTHMQFGDESIIHWKDSSGYEWTAGLAKPPRYVSGKRYPLVIQTHGFFHENDFMTDGTYTTAFAARQLAGAGMIVLQMGYNTKHMYATSSQELSDQLLGFESAIAQLNAMGLIDPKKVGVIGFSRTCYYVEGALIKDPQLFTAASITDGVDESYMQYMLFGMEQPQPEQEQMYGTTPFGQGLMAWVKNAPSFQLDRVHTPLLIGTIGPESILEEWEIYASLRMQKKPVDLLYIPDGQHILQKPLDRLASQQSNVDWFRFWLQGYEDPDSTKAAQYRRWEALRKLQEANRAP